MGVIKSKMGTTGSKMGRKFEQKRKAKRKKKQIWSRPSVGTLGRQNNSTLGSFPGSHWGWNNAGLTSTGFCRIFATC